jgi:phage host-nuclease inhibitor protein Gam
MDVVAVPKDQNEANKLIAKIGINQRKIEVINQRINERIERIKSEIAEQMKDLSDEITDDVEGLFAYAEANRDDLTDGGRTKTVKLPNGELAWRTTPPAVSIRGSQTVLATFEKLGLQQFIREKKEVDKEAILRERELIEGIKGISISQKEEFVVKPTEIDVEIIKKLKKKKK